MSAGSLACAPRSLLGASRIGETGDGQRVAFDTETTDYGARDLRDVRVLAKFLARMDVGDVHLDDGRRHGEKRIEDGNGGRRKAGRVDDKPRDLFGARLVNPIDDLALVVRLTEFHR